MNLLNRFKLPAMVGILLVVGFMSSCEQELTTIGDGVIGGEPFVTDKAVYDVFAFNKKIEAVQTNKLPIYQLGLFDDPVYGKTEATITTQLQLAAYNPTFGAFSQNSEVSGLNNAIPENETIDSVFIYLPYINSNADSDNDGVLDFLDTLPEDPTNDSDNDGVPNNQELANNTDPLNQDTDGDTINDNVDDSTAPNRFPKVFRLDSIYGNREQSFNFKLERSSFFLRDLDPSTNFQESQEFFSSQEFTSFLEEVFADTLLTIDNKEVLNLVKEDDPATEDVNEIGSVESRQAPGIYVKLNDAAKSYFQTNIVDKEGASELLSANNFKQFIRGVNLSIVPSDTDLLFLLRLTNARIRVHYHYDKKQGDDSIVKEDTFFDMSLLTGTTAIQGNAVNTLISEDYNTTISAALDTGENASKIYLKGGAGSYAEIRLFDEEGSESVINEIKANNWIINEANLVFYVDSESLTAESIEPPRLYLYNTETNLPLYNVRTETRIAETPLGVFQNYDGLLEEADGRGIKYTMKITEHINDIIVRNSTNATLGLVVTPDIRLIGSNNVMLSGGVEKDLPAASILSPLGTVLFGGNLPKEDTNRLKLEIFYTKSN